mgnify:CR=1 FL=1
MEVNLANFVNDLVVVESYEAEAAVPVGHFVVGQHCVFNHAVMLMMRMMQSYAHWTVSMLCKCYLNCSK